MNYLKNSVFWIIILILLGGAFLFVNRQSEEIEKVRKIERRLFKFTKNDVTEFTIKNSNGWFKVKKEGKEWYIVEPRKLKADQKVISDMLKLVVNASKDALLFEEAGQSKVKELGLEHPNTVMGLNTTKGTTEIFFGRKGPTHNVAYAMFKGDPRIYRIHSDVGEDIAQKTLYKLRDKTIFIYDPLDVGRLEIRKRGADRVVIEQPRSGKWDITEPEKGRAVMEKVVETLYKVRNSEIKAFVDEKTGDIAQYGLDSPKIVVSIVLKREKKTLTLNIGGKDRERRGYFARRGSEDAIFVVEEDLVDALLVDPEFWRE